MEQKFKVIYLGQLNEDSNVISVAQRFADQFKMSQDKATKILNSGKEVVLHPGVEHIKAYKLKAALENLGLQMRLERVQVVKAATENTKPENTEQEKNKPEEAKKVEAVSEEKTQTPAIQKLNTDNMSLEPMAEESEASEESDSAENEASQSVSNTETPETQSQEKSDSAPQKATDVNSPNWDLEPIQEDKEESEDGEEAKGEGEKVVAKQEYVDLSKPSVVYEKKSAEVGESEDTETDSPQDSEEKEPSAVMGFVKQFGGVIAAGLVGIIFLAKKFGLLKFLKIGGLMAAAAYAGYNPEEACMGNGDCEDAISDQIDTCWSYSELENHDWDNMSDDEYYELKPQIEEKFIGCFRYEETGKRVLESPIELRFDLIDMCDMMTEPVSDCEAIAEKQIKMCYERSEIIDPIKAADYDYYGSMLTDMPYYKNFFGCFEDNSGNMLFAEFVNEMNLIPE